MRPSVRTLAAFVVATASVAACSSSPTTQCSQAPSPDYARELREPVLRLSEHGAWGTPLQDAGIPEFTLYADGLVVFARGEGSDAQAMQARLSLEETYALVDHANAALGELPALTQLSTATDQPAAGIGVTHQGRIYNVGMYGFGSEGTEAPSAFTELRNRLAAWDHADAEPWTPDELDVVLYRVDEARSTPWPTALPMPPADAREPRERTLGRNGKTIRQPIRYRVPGSLEGALNDAIARNDEGLVVPWNGGHWRVRVERVVPARTWFW